MNSNEQELVVGLKQQVKRQVGLKKNAIEYGDFMENQLTLSWRTMIINGTSRDAVEVFIWNVIENAPIYYAIEIESKFIGVYTTIKEYTNEKKKTHLAHFTEGGKYIGSVKKLGNIPVSYKMFIDVKKYKDQVYIDFDALIRCDGECNLIVDILKFKK